MKYICFVLIFSLTFASCKKTVLESAPEDSDHTETTDKETGEDDEIEEGNGDDQKEFLILEGVKYDNQRVSVQSDSELSFVTKVFVTLVDTIYKAELGKIEWSILIPERDSSSARWNVESGIELKLSSNRKWIYSEQMWRYTFVAEIDKVTRAGSADIGVTLTNHSTGEDINRSVKVTVALEEFKSEFNGARFGMSKSEAIASIRNYFEQVHGSRSQWDELIPNVGYLPNGKFYGRVTTYEFEGDRLVRISEPSHWVSHPDSIAWAGQVKGVLKRFNSNQEPNLIDHGYGRYELKSPLSWTYNGLKLEIKERKYTFDGVEGRAIALIFEKE